MTDSSTSQQPDPVSNWHERRSRNDIVGRTKFLLPSLNGLEQLSPSPSSETQNEVPPVAPSSSGEEITSTPVSIPPTQPAIKLSAPPEHAEKVNRQFRFFSSTTAVNLRPLSTTTSLHSGTQLVPQPQANKRSQTTPFTRKIRWSSFGIIGLLCVLIIFGAFVYGYTIVNGGSQKNATTPPLAAQTSPVQPLNNSIPGGTKNFQVGDTPSIMLQSHSGNVNIHTGNVGAVMVSVNNNNQNANIHTTQTKDGQGHDIISLTTEPLDARSNYDITVPRTTLLQIDENSGSITVDGISGVTIHTQSGNLAIGNVNGPINVSTTSGDITVYNSTGSMTVATQNGSIRGNTLTGQLQASTQNGDIIIQQAMLSGQSSMKTHYGSVRFTGGLNPQGTYTMGTISGDVHLIVPANTALQLHANTGSGSIHNAFGKNSTASSLKAQIVVNVGSGSVIIDKESS